MRPQTLMACALIFTIINVLVTSALAQGREWDALECQRKGGVFDGYRGTCDTTSVPQPNSGTGFRTQGNSNVSGQWAGHIAGKTKITYRMVIQQNGRNLSGTIQYKGPDSGGTNEFTFSGVVTDNSFYFLPIKWIRKGNNRQCMAGGFASVQRLQGSWVIRGDLAGASKVVGGCKKAGGRLFLNEM